MKKTRFNDVFSLFSEFQKSVIDQKPPAEAMFEELQMMKFKIRPLQGDISSLNLRDDNLIEILWNLGKLDEFFQRQYAHLKPPHKETFYQIFDHMHQKYQDQLNRLNLKTDEELGLASTIEMEIFKEEKPSQKLN